MNQRGRSEPPGGALLSRRLVIVTGKGGTGKTTVSAALAVAAARRGLRVLAAEIGPDERLPRLVRPGLGPVGYDGEALMPGLHAMRIDPFAALAEYLSLQMGGRSLVERMLNARMLQPFLDAAPGWRELITLGKLWHLEQQRDTSGDPVFDLIVVDAPATGHGLTFLDVPRVVASAARTGPLRRNAERVEALIRDRDRTSVLPIARAEELPARETAELTERLRRDLGLEVDRVVVNAVPPVIERAGLVDRLQHARDHVPSDETHPLSRSLLTAIAECVDRTEARGRLAAHYVDEISRRTGRPTAILPEVPGGVRGIDALAELGAQLLSAMGPGQ